MKKINQLGGIFAGALLLLSMNTSQAQVSVRPTDDNFITKKDQAQHAEWKEGKSQFPGRPRDWWQLGIGGGSFLVSGDVKPSFGWELLSCKKINWLRILTKSRIHVWSS